MSMSANNLGHLFRMFSDGFSFVNPNLIALSENLRPEDARKLQRYMMCWDFYDGLHYEQIPQDDKPQTTQNWCRKLVNTYNSAEFSPGFSLMFDQKAEPHVLPFLDSVWQDNNVDSLLYELGQMKNVTGDAYIHVAYEPKYFADGSRNPDFDDPYDEYENGRIRLYHVPSSICYPRWADGYDTGKMHSCTIIYPMQISIMGAAGANTSWSGNSSYPTPESSTNLRWKIMKYVYYPDRVEQYDGKVKLKEWPNPYGVIPIVHFKNLPLAGRHYGLSDLEDIIPLNVELNLKNSDVSEILDYHAAPVTCIFGARVGQLEKGANKVWGGLPKDGDVKNLELHGDMKASSEYRNDIKETIHEIGNIPKIISGRVPMRSNMSGTALQIMFMPLLNLVKDKHTQTEKALRKVNKLILKIGMREGLLKVPEGLTNKEIYSHDILWGDMLPKDMTQQLEQLQSEFKMGLESRRGALERLKKANIDELIKEIDAERKDYAFMFGIAPVTLSPGQELVDPSNGKVVAKNEQELPTSTTEKGENKGESKITGQNKNGQDIKVVSGAMNKNPGKDESKT